jgi:hypothetical protein
MHQGCVRCAECRWVMDSAKLSRARSPDQYATDPAAPDRWLLAAEQILKNPAQPGSAQRVLRGTLRDSLANLWQTGLWRGMAHDRPGAGPGLACWLVWSPPAESNRRPHPQVKIPACGGKLPGTYKVDADPALSAEQSTAQGPFRAAHLHPSGVAAGHEPLTMDLGRTAMLPSVSAPMGSGLVKGRAGSALGRAG